MGSSQSTRKMTVENGNTVQVSQEALSRIRAQLAAKPAEKPAPVFEPPPYYEPQRRQNDYAAEEAYWAKRIEQLKRTHEKINSGMQMEYQKTIAQANKLFEKTNDDKVFGKKPPCQEESAKVLKCYEDNPGQSLMCSVIVNQFNNCVSNSRVAAAVAASS